MYRFTVSPETHQRLSFGATQRFKFKADYGCMNCLDAGFVVGSGLFVYTCDHCSHGHNALLAIGEKMAGQYERAAEEQNNRRTA